VDDATGGWGHINVDQITLADKPAHPASERALWFDYGPDDYAAVSWSDIPKSDGRRLWLGWMSNWEYGQDVPTSPWRSAMTIPRRLTLRRTAEGIRLIQQPVREMRSLRDKHFTFDGGSLAKANQWFASNHIKGDHLELVLELPAQSSGVEGLSVMKGTADETMIGVNYDRGTVFVDRTHSGNVGFNPKFPGIYEAPLMSRHGSVKLHIFVDACSVEVFVNDGERVLTALVFPAPDDRAVKCFGERPDTKIGPLEVWILKSVWK
jgi:sucrose-6-phosphate hydrolase SacC (GH32 family)